MGVASWHGSHAFLRPQGRGVGYNDHRKTKSGGRMPSKVGFLVVGAVLAVHGLLWAAEAPLAVSPGRADMGAVVESRCPTFSWGMVPGARSYELVVYQVTEEGEGDMKPVLRQSFPGSVLGWTPAMDQCLERGGQYAWSVQAAGKRGASEWSAPSLFEVAGGPSEAELEAALEIVQHYRRAPRRAPRHGQATWFRARHRRRARALRACKRWPPRHASPRAAATRHCW